MIGYDSITSYLRILRSLVYINRKPAYYLNRVFKLSCSQLGDRFHSAEFTLTLTVLHPKQATPTESISTTEKPAVPVHEHDNTNLFNRVLMHPQEVSESHVRTSHIGMRASAAHSTLLIVVICIAFVLLIFGVGIARLRSQTQVTKEKQKDKHQSCPKVNAKKNKITNIHIIIGLSFYSLLESYRSATRLGRLSFNHNNQPHAERQPYR